MAQVKFYSKILLFRQRKIIECFWFKDANPINQCHFGKYGALIKMSMSEENADYKVNFNNNFGTIS